MRFLIAILFFIINLSGDTTLFDDDKFLYTPSIQKKLDIPPTVHDLDSFVDSSSIKERSGKYIMTTINVNFYERNDIGRIIVGAPLGIGIRGGVISYLTEYLGVRGYVGLDMFHDKIGLFPQARKNNQGVISIISAGMDIMFDFKLRNQSKHFLGFFIGFGGGGFVYIDKFLINNIKNIEHITKFNVIIQFGISTLLYKKHRLEMAVRLLPTQSVTLKDDYFQSDYEPYIGYSYKF